VALVVLVPKVALVVLVPKVALVVLVPKVVLVVLVPKVALVAWAVQSPRQNINSQASLKRAQAASQTAARLHATF
jgi:hypothetical protein